MLVSWADIFKNNQPEHRHLTGLLIMDAHLLQSSIPSSWQRCTLPVWVHADLLCDFFTPSRIEPSSPGRNVSSGLKRRIKEALKPAGGETSLLLRWKLWLILKNHSDSVQETHQLHVKGVSTRWRRPRLTRLRHLQRGDSVTPEGSVHVCSAANKDWWS